MFDAQQVTVPPPEVVRSESDYALVGRRDAPMLYVRAQQSERALLRYGLYVRTDVTVTKRWLPGLDGAAPTFRLTCDWTASPYLQREPCVETLSGKLACAEPYTVQLNDRERGQHQLDDPAAETCRMEAADIASGRKRLSAAVSADAQARFDDDLKRRVTPELTKAGVTAKPRL